MATARYVVIAAIALCSMLGQLEINLQKTHSICMIVIDDTD